MGNNSAERYFNNICTQPQSKKHAIDCSTGTEDSETESDKSNGQCIKRILSLQIEKYPFQFSVQQPILTLMPIDN